MEQSIKALVESQMAALTVTPTTPQQTEANTSSLENPLPQPESGTALSEAPKGDFNSRYFKLERRDQETVIMIQEAERWAKAVMRNKGAEKIFILAGANGVGKTSVLKGMKKYFSACRMEVWRKGYWGTAKNDAPASVEFVEWSAVSDIDQRDYPLLWEELVEPSILLLDDIGAEVDKFKSGAACKNLASLLSHRVGKYTATSTNILPAQWTAQWDKRVADRLARNSTVVCLSHSTSYALRTARPVHNDP